MTALDISTPFTGISTSEDQWRDYIGAIISDGTTGPGLVVTGDSTGMQVKVSPDAAFIAGQRGESTAVKTLPVTASDPGDDRIDLVVLRNTFGVGFSLEVVAGVPAGSPVAPSPTSSAALKEMAVGTVLVAGGVATIHAGDVTSTPPPVLLPSPVSVLDASMLPAGEFAVDGAEAYTIDKGRKWMHNGTDWVIVGGVMPALNVTSGGQSVPTGFGDVTVIDFTTGETVIEDTDSLLSGNAGVVPAGMGGDWLIGPEISMQGNPNGFRVMVCDISDNDTFGEGNGYVQSNGNGIDYLAPNMLITSVVRRLEPGASIALWCYQTSGQALSTSGRLQMTLVRHMPELG